MKSWFLWDHNGLCACSPSPPTMLKTFSSFAWPSPCHSYPAHWVVVTVLCHVSQDHQPHSSMDLLKCHHFKKKTEHRCCHCKLPPILVLHLILSLISSHTTYHLLRYHILFLFTIFTFDYHPKRLRLHRKLH